jgi:phosphoglycolate phosphatase/AHBA synthesis associated protein
MDGVLVFSEEAWFGVYNETLRHFGREEVSRADFDLIYGNGTEADRDRYLPERTVEEVDAAYRRFFSRHLHRVRINEEAVDLLEELRERGIPTCVATNTNRALAEEILARVGLRARVDHVASADEAGAGKPDPAVVRLAASRLGIALEACLFVGDSRYDAGAAAAAPVRFAGYRYGSGDRVEDLRDILGRPDVVRESPVSRSTQPR